MNYSSKFLAAITAALTFAQMLTGTVHAGIEQLPPITVLPQNVLNVQVTDTEGNPIDGVTINFANGEGTSVGYVESGDKYYGSRNAKILDRTRQEPDQVLSFGVPWSVFEEQAAPDDLHTLFRGNDADGWSIHYASEPKYDMMFTEGQTDTFRLGLYYPQKTNLVVEAGQWVFYADDAWADKAAYGSMILDDIHYYFNMPDPPPMTLYDYDHFPLNTIKTYTADVDSTVRVQIGLRRLITGSTTWVQIPAISDTATEYIRYRMYLPDLFPDDAAYFCNGDATFTIDGRTYDLAKDTDETAAALVIRSGSVLTAAIPDEDGYVEFFLETSHREVHANLLYHYTYHNGAGGGGTSLYGDYIYGGSQKMLTATAVRLPDDGVNMVHVPADTYTLTYENIPEGYDAPKTTAVTVTDSKEFQYLQLVLEHSFLLGDLNLDGNVNAMDASVLLIAAAKRGAGLETGLTDVQAQAAELNTDGIYNAKDAALILQFAAYAAAGGTLDIEEFLAAK